MTDVDIIDAFLVSERRWLAVIAQVRSFHEETLGKRLQAVGWIADSEKCRLGWLGFYWESPAYWFGFGRRGNDWLPLVEVDVRRCNPAFLEEIRVRLPERWRDLDQSAGIYWRLWAPAGVTGPQEQTAWFIERSRELHEFAVAV